EAPVPQRAIADGLQRGARLPRRPADGVDEDERAHPRRMTVRGLDRDTTAEGVPDDEHLLVDVDGIEEAVDPIGVPAQREVAAREVRRAPEARERGCVHAAPER